MKAESTKLLRNNDVENKVEYIDPYFRTDTCVLRKTDKSGNVAYFHKHGREELRTCDVDLKTSILELLEPLMVIEDAIANADQHTIAGTLSAVRQHMKESLEEIFRFIDQEIGEIMIDKIYDLDLMSIFRRGQTVGARLLPPTIRPCDKAIVDNQNGGGPIYDHNNSLIEHLKSIPPDRTDNLETVMRILSDGGEIIFHPGNGDKKTWVIQI